MKLRNLLYATFAMTMVACSQENSFLSQDETGVLRTISSGSGKFASRSVVDSKWEQGDAIGVFMLKSEDASSYYSQDNVKFINNETTANTKVTFTSETGITLVNDKVKFHAYYPWSDTNVTGTTYNVQISDQTKLTNVSNSDLRWAKSDEKDLTNGTLEGGLSLNFAHKLTFLKVKTNVADVKSVYVSGVNTEAQFNIVDGTLSNEAGNTKSIQLCKTTIDEQTVYCGIVVPTTELKDFVIKIVADVDGTDMVYQYVYGDNNTLEDGLKGGCQYLFNITLAGRNANLTNIEASLGGFEGGDTPVNGQVSDPQEAVTDITVPAGTNLDGLNSLLADKSGKVSLNFADGTYDYSQIIEIPATITGLRFIGASSTEVKLMIKGLRWTQDLEELKFQGVEVESNKGYFIDNVDDELNSGTNRSCRFAQGGIVELKDCYFHGANRMFQWRGTKGTTIRYQLASFTVDNCRIEGTGDSDFLSQYDIANINFINSTFYNWSILAYAGNPDNTNTKAVFNVNNCTVAKIKKQLFEKGISITLKNSIIVDTNSNYSLVYGMEVTEASGNFAQNETTLGDKITVESGHITLKSQTELLPNYSGGDLSTMFVPASGIEAGDPRW